MPAPDSAATVAPNVLGSVTPLTAPEEEKTMRDLDSTSLSRRR